MKKNYTLRIIGIILIAILLSGCAEAHTIQLGISPSGFWSGLWHGFIAGFSFIGSLIWDDIAVYDINNNGGWYDFGFLLGIGFFTGGSASRR